MTGQVEKRPKGWMFTPDSRLPSWSHESSFNHRFMKIRIGLTEMPRVLFPLNSRSRSFMNLRSLPGWLLTKLYFGLKKYAVNKVKCRVDGFNNKEPLCKKTLRVNVLFWRDKNLKAGTAFHYELKSNYLWAISKFFETKRLKFVQADFSFSSPQGQRHTMTSI